MNAKQPGVDRRKKNEQQLTRQTEVTSAPLYPKRLRFRCAECSIIFYGKWCLLHPACKLTIPTVRGRHDNKIGAAPSRPDHCANFFVTLLVGLKEAFYALIFTGVIGKDMGW